MSDFIAKVPYLVAAVYGALLAMLGAAFWGLYVQNNPINDWLLANFAMKGQPLAYYLSIYSQFPFEDAYFLCWSLGFGHCATDCFHCRQEVA